MQGNPYQIATVEDLRLLASLVNSGDAAYLSAYYEQMADIDLSGTIWVPIGSETHQFTGTFDGQGKKILNLSGTGIGTGNGNSYFGLFAVTNGATLQNLALENVSISLGSGYAAAGAIVGWMRNGSLSTSYVAGKVETTFAAGYTGGLIGIVSGGSISDCFNAAAITAFDNAGGIAGVARDGTVIGTSYGAGMTLSTNGDNLGRITGAPSENVTVVDGYAIDGTDLQANYVLWVNGSDAASFSGFDFSSVWQMGEGYYSFPVMQISPYVGDSSWQRDTEEHPLGYLDIDHKIPYSRNAARNRGIVCFLLYYAKFARSS